MKTSFLIAGALLTAPAFAQGGDDCSTATAIGATGAFAFDTTAATTSGFDGTGTCAAGASTINQDLFWQWTAPAAGDYRFDTNGSTFDTKLSIHTGVGCAATCTAYDDDGGAGTQSQIDITGISAGDTFLIQAGGFGANSGVGTLNIGTFVDPCPGGVAVPDMFEPNDTCLTAATVTPGVYTLTSETTDTDFFTITLAANEILDVTIGNNFSIGDVDHNEFDGSCTMTDSGFGSFTMANTTGAPLVVTWEEFYDPTSPQGCFEYTMTVDVSIDPCSITTPDALEPNDACTAPATVMVGSYPGLITGPSDSDFYEFTIASGDIMDVDLTNTSGNPDVELYDSACANIGSFFGSFEYQNTTGAAQTVVFEVFNASTTTTCAEYDLTIATRPGPCQGGPDSFEPNTDCSTATPIGDGTYTGLNVQESDNDYYEVVVADGDTLDVNISFIDADGDVDLFLWDPSTVCDSNLNAFPYTGNLDLSRGVTDTEDVSYTNNTGAALTVIIEVDMFTAGACNDYDMTVTGAGGVTTIGVPFCAANPNSTGVPGLISATGSNVAANNNVTLHVDQIPALQFGIFVVSSTAGAMTPVNSGVLCLSGQIGRYSMPGEIWQADMAGSASLAIDLTMVPQPMSFATTNSGDTWFFQAWHRDIPIGNSNFTTGVEILFN